MINEPYPVAAGRLIGFGLDRKKTAASSQQYAELLDLYYSTGEFRTLVDHIAKGLGLRVVHMRTGDSQARQLVLAAEPEGVFSDRTSTYRYYEGGGADDRIIGGLIHLGIVAALYPSERELEQPVFHRRPGITLDDVDQVIRTVSEQVIKDFGQEPASLGTEEADLLSGARKYLRLSPAATTPQKRYKKSSALGRIKAILDKYVDDDLITFERDKYRPTFYYQAHVQEFATSRLYEVLSAVLQGASSGAL